MDKENKKQNKTNKNKNKGRGVNWQRRGFRGGRGP